MKWVHYTFSFDREKLYNLFMKQKESIATRLLLALSDITQVGSSHLEAFLLSAGSAKKLKHNLRIADQQFNSAFQGLERHGYLEKVNNNQFLISPKAQRKIKQLKNLNRSKKDWSGKWIIISFDIPESKRDKRDMWRAAIKRLGFMRLQNSVFISPFADLKELSAIRSELKIEKYVSFFEAQACSTEDDSGLKRYFNL